MVDNELPVSRSVTAQVAAGHDGLCPRDKVGRDQHESPLPLAPKPWQSISTGFSRFAISKKGSISRRWQMNQTRLSPKSLQCDPQIFKHHLHKVSGRNLIKTANVHSFCLLRISPFWPAQSLSLFSDSWEPYGDPGLFFKKTNNRNTCIICSVSLPPQRKFSVLL